MKTIGEAVGLLLSSRSMNDASAKSDHADEAGPAIQLDLWKKAVETQMHFNEMSVKSRQLGLSFVVAALGVAVVLLGKPEEFQIPMRFLGYQLHPSGLIILLAALGTYAVKRLDLGVYHKMLRGAVAFGEDLEQELIHRKILPTKEGMTQSISRFSREIVPGKKPTTAAAKISRFYGFLIVTLLIIGFTMLLATAQPFPTSEARTDMPSEPPTSAAGD